MMMPTHIVATAGVVENDKSEVLLVKTYHGGWVLPGGQVEVGENLIDAVAREIKEETGIDVGIEKLFLVSSNTGINIGYNGVNRVPTKIIMDFICRFVGGTLGVSEENSESRWVKKDEVLGLMTSPSARERFQAYLDYDGVGIRYLSYKTQPDFNLEVKRTI